MKADKNFEKLKDKEILILYTEAGEWTEEDSQISLQEVQLMCEELKNLGLKASYLKVDFNNLDELKRLDPKKTVVFNWCEGLGDDLYDYFTVPKILEEIGVVYSGCDPDCLKTTADKAETKNILVRKKIPTPSSRTYVGGEANGWSTFPALVKPAREHCSYGITRESVVDDSEQMHKRVDELLKEYGRGVLVEDFIEGNEYNVAIWGNGEPRVLPIGMIDYSNFPDYHDRLCGYEAKWIEGSNEWNNTQVVCPAPLDEKLRKRIEKVALDTYKACGCRDYARVDIRVRDGEPYVLDVNSNPDITTEGGFVRSTSKLGFSYGETIAQILSFALCRE